MTRAVSEHGDSFLRVDFEHDYYDSIYIHLTLHGGTWVTTLGDDETRAEIYVEDDVQVLMAIASVWCAFGQWIHWMEAVVVGVAQCEFDWDAEGPYAELRWLRRNWGSDDGFFTAVWMNEESKEYRIMLNTAQMIGELYGKFRSFVESENYDPLRYEELTVAEVAELVLEGCTLDEFAEGIATRGRSDAARLLDALLDVGYSQSIKEPGRVKEHPRHVSLAYCIRIAEELEPSEYDEIEEGWFEPEWDEWDVARRKAYVVDSIFPGRGGFWYGAHLRQLRSPLIENWLAEKP
jgi:hypothetical protein